MSVLKILSFPDERLRIKARAVENFDRDLSRLVDDMIETMYKANGIGLAATQVGRDLRLLVLDLSENSNEPMCFVNPRITHREGVKIMSEGCLSVPDFRAEVERAAEITVEALDRDGNPFTLRADGLLAVCIQHEIDHLNGKLFIDHLSPSQRSLFLASLHAQQEQARQEQAKPAMSVASSPTR